MRQNLREFLGSQEYFEAWSIFTVKQHGDLVGWKAEPSEILAKAAIVRNSFAVPFHLMKTLVLKLPDPRPIKLAKRVNLMADYAICFSVGGLHAINGAPMSLVTGDGDIRHAAQLAGCPDRIESLPDYEISVGVA